MVLTNDRISDDEPDPCPTLAIDIHLRALALSALASPRQPDLAGLVLRRFQLASARTPSGRVTRRPVGVVIRYSDTSSP